MADALCGPANPLQSLRKHTQLDRTLQQDRLVQARPPATAAEQFRSHDPRAGTLDAAINAFEHSQPPPLDLQYHHPHHHHHHHHHQDPAFDTFRWQQQQQQHQNPALVGAAAGGGGWAADFQKLHISQTPSPVPVSQFRAEAPLITNTHSGWQNDFLLQQNGGMSLKGMEVVSTNGLGYDSQSLQYQHQHQPLNTLAMQRGFMGLGQEQQQQQQQQQQWENISSEAFEAAFQDAMLSEQQAQEQTGLEQQDNATSQVKIGSDAIPYTDLRDKEATAQTAEQGMRDADDLARIAGQLVNMLKDESETNRKFRESEFLGLMRRLRDRQVEVRDNEMVETTTTTTAAAATIHATTSGGNVEQHQDHPEQRAEEQKESTSYDWAFPDMNEIYAPTNNDLDTASRSYSPFYEQQQQQQPTTYSSSSSGLGPISQDFTSNGTIIAGVGIEEEIDELYHSTSDEFGGLGLQQNHPLHPGGKWYPEQEQQQQPEQAEAQAQEKPVMSGAVESRGDDE